jgi:uncharacterized protein involved in response to NO
MQRSLPLHGEIREPASRPRFALAGKGFRPFFLLAAAFAASIVPIWIAILAGLVPPSTYLDAATWHAHEMIFGFAVAVIAGFLLTAVSNWTQRETLVGAPLLALAALWLAGRGAMVLSGSLPRGVPAAIDLAFLPALMIAIARPLVAAKNRRNFVMVGVLAALFAANVVVHLDALHVLSIGSGRRANLAAIDVVLVVIFIIGGRVFPMFTRNATGIESIRSSKPLDALAIAGMALLALIDAAMPDSRASGVGAAIVAAFALLRTWPWGIRHTARHPLLWILHVGHAWIPIGFALRAVATLTQLVSGSFATHALTVGAIGSLTIGMMARVSLGHSGRPLVVSKLVTASFVAITLAAIARALVPIAWPSTYLVTLYVAAALWTLAFVLFLFVYVPILTSPRADGKAG